MAERYAFGSHEQPPLPRRVVECNERFIKQLLIEGYLRSDSTELPKEVRACNPEE